MLIEFTEIYTHHKGSVSMYLPGNDNILCMFWSIPGHHADLIKLTDKLLSAIFTSL